MVNLWNFAYGQKLIHMDDMNWNSLKIEVEEYLEADSALDGGLRQIVQLHLQVGTENPNERDAAHNALKALLKGRDGTPFRRGQKSSIPAAVRVATDRICGVVEEAITAYYNHDPIIGAISVKHAKSGGGQYDSAEEFAASWVKKTRNSLNSQYKAGTWDGSVDTLLSSETTEEL